MPTLSQVSPIPYVAQKHVEGTRPAPATTVGKRTMARERAMLQQAKEMFESSSQLSYEPKFSI